MGRGAAFWHSNTGFANTKRSGGFAYFPGASSSHSDSQSDSQRSDGQLLLFSVSGNHSDAPVPVLSKGGWSFPSAGAEAAGGTIRLSSDIETEAVSTHMYRVT